MKDNVSTKGLSKKTSTTYFKDNLFDYINVAEEIIKNKQIPKTLKDDFIYSFFTPSQLSTDLQFFYKISKTLENGDKLYLHESFSVEKIIGKGAFGMVVAAINLRTKERVALKVLVQKSRADIQAIAQEIEIQAEMEHPNLIKIISISDFDNQIVIEMELMQGGSLKDLIIGRFNDSSKFLFSEKEISTIMFQIFKAIYYLHERNIVHHDIKPGFYINREYHVCEKG